MTLEGTKKTQYGDGSEGPMGNNPQAITSDATPRERHRIYFVDTIVFLVDNVLFQVPRIGFEGKFGTPSKEIASLQTFHNADEGHDVKHPIRLDGVQKIDFENLLEIIYPHWPAYDLPKSNEVIPKRGLWMSALRLSEIWGFADLRTKAIAHLSNGLLGKLEKIPLGKLHHVPEWILDGYVNILMEERPLDSINEFHALDMEEQFKLLKLRDRYQPLIRLSDKMADAGCRCPNCFCQRVIAKKPPVSFVCLRKPWFGSSLHTVEQVKVDVKVAFEKELGGSK